MSRRLWRNWSLLLAAGFAVFMLLALGLVLSWRSVDQSRLKEGRIANCEAIEVLKTQERAEANDRWENLGRNLRILKIESTPEIVTTAREQRDRTLERFAASSC